MLVAQARIEGLTLVTRDPAIRGYPGVAFLPAPAPEDDWIGCLVGRAETTGDIVAPVLGVEE